MPYDELLDWYEFFERRPIGWREDDRASKIIQAQGVKEKAQNLFPTLKRIYDPDEKYVGNKMIESLKRSSFAQLFQNSTGGEALDVLWQNSSEISQESLTD